MRYTDTITYHQDERLFTGDAIRFSTPEKAMPSKEVPNNPVYKRAHDIFNQEAYMYPAPPIFLGKRQVTLPNDDIYALRLLIKEPKSDFIIPQRMAFLKAIIQESASYQQSHFPDFEDRFAYLTVRSGALKSVNEDRFHVDGFQGISVPRHIPEQNYVWADSYPTTFSLQPYFVEQLDPAQHNFQDYFDEHTKNSNLFSVEAEGLYIIDPYHVHARQIIPEGTQRSFFRICYSPVEIRDDTNTPNPYLPRDPYNREDIRNQLTPYKEPANQFNCKKHGLNPL